MQEPRYIPLTTEEIEALDLSDPKDARALIRDVQVQTEIWALDDLLEGPAAIVVASPDNVEDVCHEWCCDERVSVCGRDISAEPMIETDENTVWCADCIDVRKDACLVCDPDGEEL